MPAYFVAVRNSVHNPEEMEHYNKLAMQSFAGREVKPLAAYGKIRATDGRPAEGAVVLEFPTFEAAEAWYDSPEYQAAVAHRFAGADYQTFIVEGF